MRMLFIYGAPACGKLTVAREIAKRTGFALFHNHLIVDALLAVFPFGSPEFVRLREHFWTETIQAAARSGRSIIFTFCPEPTVDPQFPERLKALVEQTGGIVSIIRLDVAEEEQERRLVAPSRTGGKLRDIELFHSLRSNFRAAMARMPEPGMAIDTTFTSAADAADHILAAINPEGQMERNARKGS